MAHSNISIFVPHAGCPHNCAFCDQRTITSTEKPPRAADVERICTAALSGVRDPADTEIAFFGGSFTAVPRRYMLELLEAAQPFIGEGRFSGIRISTRPDYIDEEILDILKAHHVTAIELGAQSMSDEVLEANERGHSAKDAAYAAMLIKSRRCFQLGLQMMVGLYKSTPQEERRSWRRIAALSPDTVRIYPVVILEGTRLGELYKSGEYQPFDFDTAVELCAGFLADAEQRGIEVIKLGLHASRDVEAKKLGGFYHPAFRELCEGRLYLRQMVKELTAAGGGKLPKIAVIAVPPKHMSRATGHKRCNAEYFRTLGTQVRFIPREGAEHFEIEQVENAD